MEKRSNFDRWVASSGREPRIRLSEIPNHPAVQDNLLTGAFEPRDHLLSRPRVQMAYDGRCRVFACRQKHY